MSRKLTYIAHPLGHEPFQRGLNIDNATKWVGYLAEHFDIVPVADWILLATCWEEIDKLLVERCDQLWMVGRFISPGMRAEALHANACGLPVFDLTGEILPPGNIESLIKLADSRGYLLRRGIAI